MKEQRVLDPTTHTTQCTDGNVASPHHAAQATSMHADDRPRVTDEQRQQRLEQARYRYDDVTRDEVYDTRIPTSTRRYLINDVPPPQAVTRSRSQQVRQLNRYDTVNVYVRRRSAPQPSQIPPVQVTPQTPHPQENTHERKDNEQATEPLRHRRRVLPLRFHWLVWVGVGMVAMLLLWIGGNSGLTWWNSYQDDLHFGRPRTYQCDASVGHNDAHTPSHFLALNLNKHIEVIEFPGGDAIKAKVYTGPTLVGDNADRDIVTVSFKDVNGDGKPDLILSVNTIKYVYLNDNGAFRPLHADEHVNM